MNLFGALDRWSGSLSATLYFKNEFLWALAFDPPAAALGSRHAPEATDK